MPKDIGMLGRKAEKQCVFRDLPAGKYATLKLNRGWANWVMISRQERKILVGLCKCAEGSRVRGQEGGGALGPALRLRWSWGLVSLDSCEKFLIRSRAFRKFFSAFQKNRKDKANCYPKSHFYQLGKKQFNRNDRKILGENISYSWVHMTYSGSNPSRNFFFFF